MAASSIYGSQIQSSAQSLAAYLQALQAKQDGNGGTIANGNANANDVATAATVVNGTGTATKGNAGKDDTNPSSGQGLDVVTLSAEAQRLLANAQAPSVGPGSLATYLNTNNTANSQVAGISSTSSSTDPLGSGYEGAIAQFRQWLSRPLGQPVPYSGDATYDPNRPSVTNTSDQATSNGTQPVSSTTA